MTSEASPTSIATERVLHLSSVAPIKVTPLDNDSGAMNLTRRTPRRACWRPFSLVTSHLDVAHQQSRKNKKDDASTNCADQSSSITTTSSSSFVSADFVLMSSSSDSTLMSCRTANTSQLSPSRRRASFPNISSNGSVIQHNNCPQTIDWDETSLRRFLTSYCYPDATTSTSHIMRSPSRGLLLEHHESSTDALWDAVELISAALNHDATDRFTGHTILGSVFLTLQRPSLAIAAFLNALWIATATFHDDPMIIGMALHRLGKAYVQHSQAADAIPALQKAISVYETEQQARHLVVQANELLQQARDMVQRHRRRSSRKCRLDLIQEEP